MVLESDVRFIALLLVGRRQRLVEHLYQRIEDSLLSLFWKLIPKIPEWNLG